MIGKQNRWQGTLFMTGSLKELIPSDHILKRVDKVLDISWLHKEVSDCCCGSNGRPGDWSRSSSAAYAGRILSGHGL